MAPERLLPRSADPTAATAGLTLLRVVLGAGFLLHGWQEVAGWTVAGTQASFARLGVPLAEVAAPPVAVLELVGGLLLVLGLGTRAVASALFALAGPGRWSLDRPAARRRGSPVVPRARGRGVGRSA